MSLGPEIAVGAPLGRLAAISGAGSSVLTGLGKKHSWNLYENLRHSFLVSISQYVYNKIKFAFVRLVKE